MSDDEIVRYYVTELARIGGASSGRWQVAVALALTNGVVQVESLEVRTRFVMQARPIQIAGAPLSSLMLDPATNRYYSEMSYAERPDSVLLRNTLRTLLQYC